MIDRKIELVLMYCCTKRNRNGVIALDANKLHEVIVNKGLTLSSISELLRINHVATYRKLTDIKKLTIGEAILLKEFLELSDREAAVIFLGA